MKNMMTLLLLLVFVSAMSSAAFANATITIVNGDGPGEGFNDPAPAAPVGGNPGTTVGEQRLIAFQHAASIWAGTLDSTVEIKILALFDPLTCTAGSAVLGSAGTRTIWSDFPNAPQAGIWYHAALANKYSGFDLYTEADDPTGPTQDLRARFNVNLGQPTCLAGSGWYYGLDANEPAGQIDLVAVLLHEFAHGLGFSQFASVSDGSRILDQSDVYGEKILDVTTGKSWGIMTNAERAASAINSRKVVWTGAKVTEAAPSVLNAGTPLLRVNSPAGLAGVYSVGAASFGPVLSSPGVTGDVVAALSAGAGGAEFQACTPIINPGDVAGKIALVNRGTCTFVVKAANVQAAGAIAMIVADNAVGAPPAGLGGADPTIVIPSVRITITDGALIRAALPGVNATLGVDPTLLAGLEASTHMVHLNAPNPVQPGSSISHWDPITQRNQLMEPSINTDLTHSLVVPQDLTERQMRDIGWYVDADLDMVDDENGDLCLSSDLSAQLVIAGCATGVETVRFSSPAGCPLSDLVHNNAAGASTHGGFASTVSHLSNQLKDLGLITGAQKGKMQSCAAGAGIP